MGLRHVLGSSSCLWDGFSGFSLWISLWHRQRAAGQAVLSWVPAPGCPCWDADSGFGASRACGTLWFWFAVEKLPPCSVPSPLSGVSLGIQT